MEEKLTPEDMKYIELADEVEEMEGNIKNSEDFIELLIVLREGYEDGLLPKQPVEAYINGMIDMIERINEDIKANHRDPIGPVDWIWLSHIMKGAFES